MVSKLLAPHRFWRSVLIASKILESPNEVKLDSLHILTLFLFPINCILDLVLFICSTTASPAIHCRWFSTSAFARKLFYLCYFFVFVWFFYRCWSFVSTSSYVEWIFLTGPHLFPILVFFPSLTVLAEPSRLYSSIAAWERREEALLFYSLSSYISLRYFHHIIFICPMRSLTLDHCIFVSVPHKHILSTLSGHILISKFWRHFFSVHNRWIYSPSLCL